MTRSDVGTWTITITVSQLNVDGTTEIFTKAIKLHIKEANAEKPTSKAEIEVKDLSSKFKGIVVFEPQKVEKNRPIPYISDFSPTGIMTIGWDRPMTPYDRPNEIPPIQVAVDADLLKN